MPGAVSKVQWAADNTTSWMKMNFHTDIKTLVLALALTYIINYATATVERATSEKSHLSKLGDIYLLDVLPLSKISVPVSTDLEGEFTRSGVLSIHNPAIATLEGPKLKDLYLINRKMQYQLKPVEFTA